MPIGIRSTLGDAICAAIEKEHGVRVDIILMVAPSTGEPNKDWSSPDFITSLHPDVMEAVITQIGEQMADSKGGPRVTTKD